jgi:hypothetical protein
MAVLIQEVVGSRRRDYYFPHISGVAQSYNYYPVAYLKPEDGIAVVAMGLGKYVIDGEKAHRFCPLYPKIDFLTPEDQLQYSQESLYAINMLESHVNLIEGDDATLTRLSITDVEDDGTLQACVSTWDYENNRLQLGGDLRGPRVVNFAYVLKYRSFPLAKVLETVLDIVKGAMGTPVEIEFAVEMVPGGTPSFYILQIKPLLGDLEDYNLDVSEVRREDLVLYTERAMGNGTVSDLRDLIYVDPETFDKSRTVEMTEELGELNAALVAEDRRYVLIGPGRWGSRDPWLGIPVGWNHISGARVIVEVELPDFKVDPSLGSHFFHNVTSMNIGYFDIPHGSSTNFLDWEWLRAQTPAARTEHFVHVSFDRPLVAKMDGRKRTSVLFKPEAEGRRRRAR